MPSFVKGQTLNQHYAAKMSAEAEEDSVEDPPIARAVEVGGWGTAVAVEASEISTAAIGRNIPSNFDDGIRHLCSRGMPPGLAEVVAASSRACATRYWIVDNSGSMQTLVQI